MKLKAFRYRRILNAQHEWAIAGCDGAAAQFGNMNLLTGRNSAGKSRTLGTLREIADLLAGRKTVDALLHHDNYWLLQFETPQRISVKYELKTAERRIVEQNLWADDRLLMHETSPLICTQQTDRLQQLEEVQQLLSWGNNLHKVNFTNQIEKKLIVDTTVSRKAGAISTYPVLLLQQAIEIFGDSFCSEVIEDMGRLDYKIESIGIDIINGKESLYAKEIALPFKTGQVEMSQGMYRALSFIMLLVYASRCDTGATILIDDMGEGIDTDRSKVLTELLMEKTANSGLQLFVSTNNRYIMNMVPLDYWTVIENHTNASLFYNIHNSEQHFLDFKYTGLNNYDFLETKFYRNGFEDDEQ